MGKRHTPKIQVFPPICGLADPNLAGILAGRTGDAAGSAFPSLGGFYLPHLLVLQEAQRGMSRTGKHRTASGCAAERDEHSKTSTDSEKLSPDDAKVQDPGVIRQNNEAQINITALNEAKNNIPTLWFFNIFPCWMLF